MSSESQLDPSVVPNIGLPSSTPDSIEAQLSKREKRKLREAKKHAEQASSPTVGVQRPPSKSSAPSSGAKFETINRRNAKNRSNVRQTENTVTDAQIQKTLAGVDERRVKMTSIWGSAWNGESLLSTPLTADFTSGLLAELPSPIEILCLGLGKPYLDRSAQIQLALVLELSKSLQVGQGLSDKTLIRQLICRAHPSKRTILYGMKGTAKSSKIRV